MESNGAEYIVCNCLEKYRRNVLVIYDDRTGELASIFQAALLKCGKKVEIVKLEMASCHGMEPPEDVSERIMHSDAVVCLTWYSIAHTYARRRAEEHKIAFLSMPEYTTGLLNNPAIFADYRSLMPMVKKYSNLLTDGKEIVVETQKGTKVYLNIENRIGNCCPGMTSGKILLGSPPDVEANIAPVENKTNGKLVIDGAITDSRIGLLEKSLTLTVHDGVICEIFSEDHGLESEVKSIFSNVKERNAYVVGEFGIGFNDCAVLCGNMLVDEGSRGCVHFGMGSNWTIGGKNKVPFHLDFVMRNPTVMIDNIPVIEQGELLYES